MCYTLRMQRKLSMHVKSGLICSKDCLKWPFQSLLLFPLSSLHWYIWKRNRLSFFVQALTWCEPDYWAPCYYLYSFSFHSVSSCIFFVDLSIYVYFLLAAFPSVLPPFTFLITKEHVSCWRGTILERTQCSSLIELMWFCHCWGFYNTKCAFL